MPSVWQVQTVFSGRQGAPWLNTMHFLESVVSTASAAVSAVGTFWGIIDSDMNSSITWTTVADVLELDILTGQPLSLVNTTPATGSGGSSNEMLPPAVQGCLRTKTGVFIAGRQVQGKVFIPGINEARSNNGVPDSAEISTVNTAAAGLISGTSNGWCVFSRKHHQADGIGSASMWDQWAILKSRRD